MQLFVDDYFYVVCSGGTTYINPLMQIKLSELKSTGRIVYLVAFKYKLNHFLACRTFLCFISALLGGGPLVDLSNFII